MAHLTVPRDHPLLCADQNMPRSGMLKGVRYQDLTKRIYRQDN